MNRDDIDAMRDEFDGRYVRQATCDERLCWENRHNMNNRRIELRKMDYDPRDPERCVEGYNDLKKMEG